MLLTSPYTKILNAPALITFNEARTDTDEKEYNSGVKVISYLIEGKFKSLYQNQFTQKVLTESPETKILVCSDGDLIVNEIDKKTGNPFPLGFDKYSQHQYGNQDFVINALNYLTDENGLITSKTKSIGLRPLDQLKVKNERVTWQTINIAAPLVLLGILGLLRFWWLRKTYG